MINLKEMFKKEKQRAEKKERLLDAIQNETGYKKVQAESKLREFNLINHSEELNRFWNSAKDGTLKNNKQPSDIKSKQKLIILAKSLGFEVDSKMSKKDILVLIDSKKGENLDAREQNEFVSI